MQYYHAVTACACEGGRGGNLGSASSACSKSRLARVMLFLPKRFGGNVSRLESRCSSLQSGRQGLRGLSDGALRKGPLGLLVGGEREETVGGRPGSIIGSTKGNAQVRFRRFMPPSRRGFRLAKGTGPGLQQPHVCVREAVTPASAGEGFRAIREPRTRKLAASLAHGRPGSPSGLSVRVPARGDTRGRPIATSKDSLRPRPPSSAPPPAPPTHILPGWGKGSRKCPFGGGGREGWRCGTRTWPAAGTQRGEGRAGGGSAEWKAAMRAGDTRVPP